MKSQQELYQLFIDELQSQAPELTDTNEGSTIDVLAGVASVAVNELLQLATDEFKKTFFDTADGPEVTGGVDNLENLAVDHFGDDFARPEASAATGTVTFSRPNTDAGNVTIGVGTIVKTLPDASGVSQRFEVVAEVTLVGLSISASVRALVPGPDGNAVAGTVTVVETTLTDDTVVVTNAADFAGGDPTETDAEYRETIRNLITTIRGATVAAIVAKALTVDGVETATVLEFKQYVKEWNIGTDTPVGTYFPIARARLYIADVNGTASLALLQSVRDAIETTRAAGVFIEVLAGSALTLNWSATLSLNPSGPNYATLVSDASMIEDTMTKYIQDLDIGEDFIIATAEAAMMAIWGPAGTDDLTDFDTTTPVGNVTASVNQKLVPGVIST